MPRRNVLATIVEDPRLLTLTPFSRWRFLELLVWARRYRVERVSRAVLRRRGISPRVLVQLVELGLLEADGDGYRIVSPKRTASASLDME